MKLNEISAIRLTKLNAFSLVSEPTLGVLQGSILGPLIFSIFINELPAVVEDQGEDSKDSSIVVFADDNTPSMLIQTSCMRMRR